MEGPLLEVPLLEVPLSESPLSEVPTVLSLYMYHRQIIVVSWLLWYIYIVFVLPLLGWV